uniref:DUF1330 domain-containing protein n=1 Tax=Macrostomum lignano TaxID=282301 RepID=A0A1I8IUF2_9PLAT
MVIYNFALLDPGPDDLASQPDRYFALRTMAAADRLDLLRHPLSSALLQYRWYVVHATAVVQQYFQQ